MSEGITEVYKKGTERSLHLWVNSSSQRERRILEGWRVCVAVGRGTNLKNNISNGKTKNRGQTDGGEMKEWRKDGWTGWRSIRMFVWLPER